MNYHKLTKKHHQMRLFILILTIVFLPLVSSPQSWVENFYSTSESKNTQNFYEMQRQFNEYWKDYDIDKGYYYVNGVKRKAGGWKQFKRWEWYWETRINRETGSFPQVNILENHRDFYKNTKSETDESNWVEMGPYSSDGGYAGIGRINCVAFHPSDPNTFFVGAPSGGLWRTTNGGQSWEVLTDELPVIGVSEVIVPNDYDLSNTLYIATGDRDAGDNYSIGVLKSTDDGVTWDQTGLSFNVSDGARVTRLLVHPSEQNIFYAATNGGIYKSTDATDNWEKIIENGVFFDLEFKHNCEDTVLFAASADYWGESKIYKTKDAGATWDAVFSFPNTVYRVELDVAQSDSTIVYALASTREGGMDGIYKSIDSGNTFIKIYDGLIPGNNLLNWFDNSQDEGGQGWYDLTLSVSPINANTLYLGGVNSWKSIDGGYNWSITNHWYGANGTPAVHADKHYMEFQNSQTFFEANDGGIYLTNNGGDTWIDLSNDMVISQMYKLGVSQTVKDEVITGLQDNGSKLITEGAWYDVKGGDGMECIIDYEDVNIQYATYVNGQIDRTTDRWSTYYNTVDISANIPGGPNGAWVTPYLIDPNNNSTIYVGYADVWKSNDRGNSWTKISSLNLSNKIRSIAIASANSDVIYLTDHNNFYKTTDGGQTWINLTSKLPPTSNAITYITVDELFPDKVWLTFGGYNNQKVFESTDGGDTWVNISQGLPEVPANTIIQNKISKTQQLYAGTDMGVFIKNGDADWSLFSKNLPSVIVSELEIHYDNDQPNESVLYASTYGRGLWKSNLASFSVPEIKIVDFEGPFTVSNDSTARLDINFTHTETFSGNTFTAYLSDESGDFTSATSIGSLESDEPGTIEAVIPVGSLSGKNYRVKVVSSSPVFESAVSKPFEIILDDVSPTATITSDVNSNTSNESFDVTITFNEPIVGFEESDINVSNANINSFSGVTQRKYVVEISPLESGMVTIDIPANIAYDMFGNWNTSSDQWSINYTVTSVDQLAQKGINVFPNPTSGKVNIEFENHIDALNISVFDIVGRSVYKEFVSGSDKYSLNLSFLEKSIYVVKLNIGDEEVVFRLVIE